MSQRFSGRNFKIVSFQIVSFSWLFHSSLVSRFLFCCVTGNRGCGLVQPHNFAYEKTSHLPGHIWASSVMASSAEMCTRSPYLFRFPSSLCLRARNKKWRISFAVHLHSQFVGTLANFDLVTLLCAIPLAWNKSQYNHLTFVSMITFCAQLLVFDATFAQPDVCEVVNCSVVGLSVLTSMFQRAASHFAVTTALR